MIAVLERDWPPLQRRLARFLRATGYALAAAAGGGVLIRPSGPVAGELGTGVLIIGGLAVVAGLVALVGVLARRWQVEWIAVWFVAAAFGGYAVVDWSLVAAGAQGRFAGAASLSVGVAFLLARGVDLWVFSLNARSARAERVNLWRWVSGLDR